MWIDGVILTYGILCATLFVLRHAFAHMHFHLHHESEPLDDIANLSISVIYPVYHESPKVLEEVMGRAIQCLESPKIEFIFVDDGSPNRIELQRVYRRFETRPRIQVIYQDNRGKREAQYTGLSVANGEYIVTVDSDTLISLEGLIRLTAPFRQDIRIGAICGEVLVENASENLLTKMIAVRYWTAFNVERAAQGFFRSVLCCSGPFSAYRADILHKIKGKYIGQTFCGRKCTYGDDRHLTNLVLSEGYQVVYQPNATAWTFVPNSLGEYVRQQTRWNKSFYREILWTLKVADRVHPFSLLDMILQPLLFLAFTLSVSHVAYLVLVAGEPIWAFYYLAILLVMAFARGAYGLYRTHDFQFLFMVAYGFLHAFVLIPVRFKSLLTLSDNRWGTRLSRRVNTHLDFSIWAVMYSTIIAINTALLFFLKPTSPTIVPAEGGALTAGSAEWNTRLIFPLVGLLLIFLSLFLIRYLVRSRSASTAMMAVTDRRETNLARLEPEDLREP